MKRRELLAAGLSMTGALIGRSVFGQAPDTNRGAVVIGVDKVGDLPKLKGAASGAQAVGKWLSAEGFDVKVLVDDSRPVVVGDVKQAVKELVNRPATLDQLVVYFAGHGFVSSTNSEFWLLSDAPDDLNAAVSLNECHSLARRFDIANVVFISDACRSRADTLRALDMKGSLIFPSGNGGNNVTTEVDRFLATRVGYDAYEAGVADSAKSFNGIYTTCFLDAFKRPYADMVQPVKGKPVVPNRRLKEFLTREVPRRARRALNTIEQHPDAEVCSDEPTYIAHVSSNERTSRADPTPTISEVATKALDLRTVGPVIQPSPEALRSLAQASGFADAQAIVVQARGLPPQEKSRTGFTIVGQRLKDAMTRPGAKAEIVNPSDQARMSATVELYLDRGRAASVALLFPDGSGTVLAAIDGYIGTVVVEDNRVVNVTYEPSPKSGMRSAYQSEVKRLDSLHAAVAASARFGVLRFEGPKAVRTKAAEEFADRIRVLKGIDPTLGLYAAYAYAEADLPNQVRSVQQIMRGDLGIEFFDVAMLSGALTGKSPGLPDIVPFVPMLSQGWGQLRVRDVRLQEPLIAAREMLRRSLWTTLTPNGMKLALETLSSGRVM